MQNSDFRNRLTSVCWSQTSSVGLRTHNSVLSTRIKRQSGCQPSPVVLCMQTATLALELLVSIVLCPHLRFLHANQRLLDQNCKSLRVQDLTCRFVHAKQRLLEQNYNYLCVTALICGFCIHNSSFWTRISSLYGSQTSSVVLSTHNCVLNTRI